MTDPEVNREASGKKCIRLGFDKQSKATPCEHVSSIHFFGNLSVQVFRTWLTQKNELAIDP